MDKRKNFMPFTDTVRRRRYKNTRTDDVE